jgi:hypothetical protein
MQTTSPPPRSAHPRPDRVWFRKAPPAGPPSDDGASGSEQTDSTTDETEAPERWLRCVACSAPIARPEDAFSMPPHGPIASFINPGGYVHEVMTFTTAPGAVWGGPRIPADSWFPGYTWRFGVCAVCEAFVGWYYQASAGASVAAFWGLRRGALKHG